MAVKGGRLGQLGSVKFRLASWLPADDQYSRQYVPLTAETASQAGSDRIFSGEQGVRIWSVRSFERGEGYDVWKPNQDGYRISDGVSPPRLGDGLVLSRLVAATKDSGGSSDLADGQRLGFGLGGVWALHANSGYKWDAANGRWAAGISTGASGSDATSLTDGDDTYMYSGHVNNTIRRWKSGTAAQHVSSGVLGNDPIVRSFGGYLYALDGDDIYEVDKTTTNTVTARSDVGAGSSAVYLAATPWCFGRMSTSDKGPIWLQVLDNGQTFIWEYNVEDDAQEKIGKLPTDFAFPYSIFFANGFYFIGFRYAHAHNQEGEAYIYYQRGAQRGVAGPLQIDLADTASEPVLIAGMSGDDLIFYCAGVIWAYNVTSGGLSRVGATVSSGAFEDAITFGKEIFVSGAGDKVDWAQADKYVAAGSVHTGRYDMEYPGLRKRLLDVTLITEPLPANTTATMAVSVDGGPDVALSGTHNGDDDRRYTFAGPADDTLTGYQFELVPSLATTDEAESPRILEVGASAGAAAARIAVVLAIDCSEMSAKQIDDLNALDQTIVTFSDPFQQSERESPDSYVVNVDTVVTPKVQDANTPEELFARVRLLSRDLVAGTGGS